MDAGPQQRLVAWLSAHPGSWSTEELAHALGVTSRSIRNYITRLNAAAPAELVRRTAKGYRLADAISTTTPPAPSTREAESRLLTLLRLVLTANSPANVYGLAEELGVSESTIENDVRRLARLADRHGVRIVRRQDEVWVEGREADQRQLMRQAVTDVDRPAEMLTTDKLESAYSSYDIRDIKRRVAAALADNGLHCNDYTLNPLILDLVIAVDRITDDHTLEGLEGGPRIQADPRLAGAASKVTDYLTGAYGVEFTLAEIDAVALLIASKTTLLRGATDHDVVVDHVGTDLVELVRTILSRLDDTYLVDLTDDAFVTSIALHTHNMLLRARGRRPQPNPLAAGIRRSHPLVHELAVFYANEIERETGTSIDPDEVGFIAFHLGSAIDRRRDAGGRVTISLVVPAYHDLAQRMADRIATALGDRAVVEQVIESAEPTLDQLLGNLVVTSLAVPGLHPSRQVLISPLLSQADLDLIDLQVRSQQQRNTWMRLASQLHELFHDRLFFASPNARDREEVLALLCGALVDTAAVPGDFLAQVLQREELSATAFNDIVAIPHTLGMPAQRTSIAVATFGEPIDWAGTPVRLVLLVAFSAQDRNLFRDTFDQLVITLTEPRNVVRLVESDGTFGGFLRQLGELMQAE
ncbi:MAG: PTS sugar transporter subunit IIA [Actinobacteria bacterium]|nr:PTS sugar transporter subunit IIA [Actinomycetota bacterium]